MEVLMIIRQVKYFSNIVEQDHRALKRITKPMLGFKSFNATKSVLAGIELMHMICKGQSHSTDSEEMFFADQFYALTGEIRSV
jgi:putative transposase